MFFRMPPEERKAMQEKVKEWKNGRKASYSNTQGRK
jgi:hypothetical protein